MVTRSKASKNQSKTKLGKLKLNKETVKDLTLSEQKGIRAGDNKKKTNATCKGTCAGICSCIVATCGVLL